MALRFIKKKKNQAHLNQERNSNYKHPVIQKLATGLLCQGQRGAGRLVQHRCSAAWDSLAMWKHLATSWEKWERFAHMYIKKKKKPNTEEY